MGFKMSCYIKRIVERNLKKKIIIIIITIILQNIHELKTLKKTTLGGPGAETDYYLSTSAPVVQIFTFLMNHTIITYQATF